MSFVLQCEWLDRLQEGVWLVDEKSLLIEHANQKALALVQTTLEAVKGKSVLSLAATPQDMAFWAQPVHLLANGLQSHTKLLQAGGGLLPVGLTVAKVPKSQGEGTQLLVSMVDLSHQEASEHELEKLLSELRATLDSVADGILVCGLDGSIRAFNQRLAQLWSMPADLLIERNDAAIYAHMQLQVSDTACYASRLQAISSSNSQESTDIILLARGAVIEMRSVPQLSRGRAIGRVFAYRDVTRLAETQASQRLAARVFEASLDAIFIADNQHRLVRMNPGCQALLGLHAETHDGTVLSEVLQRCRLDLSDFMEQVQHAWTRDGFWEGEIQLLRHDGVRSAVQLSWVALRDDSGRLLQSIGFMRDVTQKHADQQRIKELAYSDVLTGLPNRLLLSQRVDAAMQGARDTQTSFAILFLDLDRFKIINDSLGHMFGDRVLQLVAARIQSSLRQSDTLCRLGGDEFVLHLHGCDGVIAESVARRILDDMLKPFMLDGMGFSIQCSIGIAMYPQDGNTLDELIKQADTAMYGVKERGRGNYGFYTPQMNVNLLSRMRMEHAMRQALGAQRMTVHFQPQVHFASGRITGAEALVRWNDPDFGMVSPGQFIGLAEESGYIVTLGAWVMEQAIQEAAAWLQAGTPLMIAVNVSALEFRQPDFVDRTTRLLALYQLPPTLLELELTESILLQDAQEMEQRLHALASLGISLAIDDFGTGYSSLGYLKKLPIHRLKIDQSFVRGLPDDDGDHAIVSAIISMGRSLHIEVVAEGVESEVQKAVLQHMHCDHYQGYLCSPALPAAEFRALIAQSGSHIAA